MPISRLFYEIGADTKQFDTAITRATDNLAQFDQKLGRMGASSVRSFENFINPSNQLAKELDTLGKAGYSVEQMWLKYGAASQEAERATRQHGAAVNPMIEAFNSWAKSTGRVSDAVQFTTGDVQKLGMAVQQFVTNPLQGMQAGLTSVLGMLGPTAIAWGAIGAAAGAAAFSIAKFDEKISDEYIHLKNTAAAAGLTVSQVQALDRMGVEAGVEMDKLARMFGMLNRELATGTKMDFVKVLNAMRQSAGEGAADIKGGIIPILGELDKKLADVTSETDKAQLMNAAFNRRLQDIAVLLSSTHGHFLEYLADMEKTVTYTPEQQKALQEQHDAIVAVGRAFEEATVKAKGWFALQLQQVMQGMGHGIPTWTTSPFRPPAPTPLPVPPGNVQQLTPAEAQVATAAAAAARSAAEMLAEQTRAMEYAKLVKNGMLEDKALAGAMADAMKQYYAALERYFLTGEDAEAAEAEWWNSKYGRFKLFQSQIGPLNIALANAEEKYSAAVNAGIYQGKEGATYWAAEYNRIKDTIEEIKKTPQEFEKYLGLLKEAEKIQEHFETKSHEAWAPSAAETAARLKPITQDMVAALQWYNSTQRQLTRDTTQGLLNQLKLEQQITSQIVPRNEYERYQVELYKTGLDFAVREEEIRVKYAQKRYDLESKIATLATIPILGPTLAGQAMEQLRDLDAQMEAELDQTITLRLATIIRIHAQEYKRMIDVYKQYAGELFDAILDTGKSGFMAILDWLKNDFKQLLRAVFENLLAGALQTSGLYEGIRKFLSSTYPTGGPLGAGIGGGFLPGPVISSAVEEGVSSAFTKATTPTYEWNPVEAQWAPQTATGYSFVPQSLSGLGAFGGGAGIAGGGFGLANLLMSAGPAALLGGGIAGVASSNPWAKAAGATGLGLFGGAAAITAGLIPGVGAASIGSALGGMFTMGSVLMAALPIIAPIIAAVIGIPLLIKAAQGKNAFEAGGIETSRDFGVKTGTDWTTQLFQKLNISESQGYGIRKDILSSPQALTQLGALAKQQGTYDSFLKSLERVTTKWGTFNFRAAYEIGDVTGDWSALDKVFIDAFEHSDNLRQVMPDWKDILTVGGDAAKKAAGEFEAMWQQVQTTGVMTQELTDYLEANAASLNMAAAASATFKQQLDAATAAAAKFKELSPIIMGFQGMRDSIDSLVPSAKSIYQIFLETGQILPELSAQILQYGGNLQAFQRLSDLAGIANNLQKGLKGIQDLASAIAGLQKTAIQQVLAGEWGPHTWEDLAAMGLDPSKLTAITDAIRYKSGWDQAVNDFFTKQKWVWDETQKKYVQQPVGIEKGSLFEQALWQFGGPQGTQALANWGGGFNTITPDLLEMVGAGIETNYQNTIDSTLEYLGTAAQAVQDQIDDLTPAIQDATADVVAELDLILKAINKVVLNTASAPVTEATAESVSLTENAGGGGEVPRTGREVNRPGIPREQNPALVQTVSELSPEEAARLASLPATRIIPPLQTTYTIVVNGNIYASDFPSIVEKTMIQLQRRGSPAFAAAGSR